MLVVQPVEYCSSQICIAALRLLDCRYLSNSSPAIVGGVGSEK